jgi:hypothetical protein
MLDSTFRRKLYRMSKQVGLGGGLKKLKVDELYQTSLCVA